MTIAAASADRLYQISDSQQTSHKSPHRGDRGNHGTSANVAQLLAPTAQIPTRTNGIEVVESYMSQATSPSEQPAAGVRSEQGRNAKAVRQLDALMKVAVDASFEDGFESNLARRLQTLLRTHGEDLILAFPVAMESTITSTAAIAEALTEFGVLRDGVTEESRLRLLLAYLSHPDSLVRYGAARGLWELGDRRAASALHRQAASEPNSLVRSTLLAATEALS